MVKQTDWDAIKQLIDAAMRYHNKVASHKFDSTRVDGARKEYNDAVKQIETGVTFDG